MAAALLLVIGLAATPLSERHRVFLEDEAHFLLTAGERARFTALETDELRELFIESFWRRWDRAEHRARLTACERWFGPRGRWSERGRALQLLGAPDFREDLTRAGRRLAPAELWHYTGVDVSFLPESFYLIFFRPGGVSDYRLWSPITDGVAALVSSNEPRRLELGDDPELGGIDPELALAVESLVPGGGQRETLSLLASLDAFPELHRRHRVFGEDVRIAVAMRELPVRLASAVLEDDAGVAELHYALDLPPGASEALPWRVHGARLRVSLTLIGRLVGALGERERWEDTIELDVSAEEKRELTATALRFRGRRVVQPDDELFDLALVTDGAGAIVTGLLEPAGADEALRFERESSLGPARVVMRARTPAETSRYRFARGVALARRGARVRAIEELEAAAESGAAEVRVHLELARLLYTEGRHRDVLEHLGEVAPRFADEVDLWVLMAGSAEALGRFEAAVGFYDRALALAPENPAIALARERVDARRTARCQEC